MANHLKNPFKQYRAERRSRLMEKATLAASFLGILVLCSSAGIARIAAPDGTLPVVRGSTDPNVSIGVQTGPTIGVQKGTTWRRCVGVDYGHGFCAGAGVGRA